MTMKAFSILLLTDPCEGLHSPHGWELSVLEYYAKHINNIISFVICYIKFTPQYYIRLNTVMMKRILFYEVHIIETKINMYIVHLIDNFGFD